MRRRLFLQAATTSAVLGTVPAAWARKPSRARRVLISEEVGMRSTLVVAGAPAPTVSTLSRTVTDSLGLVDTRSQSLPVSAFPDASNTGPAAAGYTNLTTVGSIFSASAGQVITGLRTTGLVRINHPNVTLRGCDLSNADSLAVVNIAATGAVFEDCEIHTTDPSVYQDVGALMRFTSGGGTVRRCNIHGANQHAVMIGETTDQLFEDNYFHDHIASSVIDAAGQAPHCNIIIVGEAPVGPQRIVIRRNTLDMWVWSGTYPAGGGHMSNLLNFAQGAGNTIGPVTVADNWCAGGGAVFHGGGDCIETGMVFTGNHLSTKYTPNCGAGLIMNQPPAWGSNGSSWSGNVWQDGSSAGAVIPAP